MNKHPAPIQFSVWRSKIFLAVLALKLICSLLFASPYLSDLFTPFVNWHVENNFSNPWQAFYERGALRAFPYPTTMLWIMSIPRYLFSPFLPEAWESVTALHLFVMRLPLLACDLLVFALLLRFAPTQQRKILFIYWCSPIVFFICYIHGQLDVIPTALFLGSTWFLLTERFIAAGMLLALAAAGKNHIFVALPFLLVYLYRKTHSLALTTRYFVAFLATYLMLIFPYANSVGFWELAFHSPEQAKLFEFLIPLSPSLNLVVCPIALALLFMKFASYRKLNREILLMFLGLAFAAMVIFVPPMPGWFLWSLPFIIYFYLTNREYSRIPFLVYNVVYILYFTLLFEQNQPLLAHLSSTMPLADLGLSITLASMAYITLWMFQLGVKRNEELREKEKPLLIGIGGDSGAGKHTLLRVLRNVVGKDRSIPILGDNFHKWERGDERWQVYTHLHPSANNLHQGVEAAVALAEGQEIRLVNYDHSTGKFSEPETIAPNKFIFFTGLHPFYLKRMRELITLKIFIDTEEPLRKYWKLKRDSEKRGHHPEKVLESLRAREDDSKRYIEPQREYADLVIHYAPTQTLEELVTPNGKLSLRTTYFLDNSVNLEPLVQLVAAIPTLEISHQSDIKRQELSVTGSIGAREVMSIAYTLRLNLDELQVNTRGWLRDMHGVTQLVFLLLYNHKMQADTR